MKETYKLTKHNDKYLSSKELSFEEFKHNNNSALMMNALWALTTLGIAFFILLSSI